MGRALAFGVSMLGGLLIAAAAHAADLGTIRIGVLQFGTVNWELDVIEQHGLDAKEGFNLEVAAFASNDAADVALMGEAVDGIVEDWLWVSRQRAEYREAPDPKFLTYGPKTRREFLNLLKLGG